MGGEEKCVYGFLTVTLKRPFTKTTLIWLISEVFLFF